MMDVNDIPSIFCLFIFHHMISELLCIEQDFWYHDTCPTPSTSRISILN